MADDTRDAYDPPGIEATGRRARRERWAISLSRRESELVERERHVVALEINAAAGFARQNDEALRDLVQRREVLLEQMAQLEHRLQTRNREIFAAEEDARGRQAQREQEEAATLQRRSYEAHDTLDRELDERRRQFDAQLAAAQAEFEREVAEQREAAHAARKQKLDELAELHADAEQTLIQEISDQRQAATRERAAIRLAQAQLKEQNRTLQERLDDSSSENAALRTRQTRLETELAEMQHQWTALGGGSAGEILRRWQERDAELAVLRSDRASVEDTKKLQDVMNDFAVLKTRAQQLEQENYQLKRAEALQEVVRGDYETLQQTTEGLRGRVRILTDQLKALWEDYDRLGAKTAQNVAKRVTPELEEYRRRLGDLTVSPLAFSAANNYAGDETSWLGHLKARIHEAGMEYPARLVDSFHTCLKIADWSPLTVLAGISGTGKSKLPEFYAHFGGIYFDSIAVQPNWDSPQDIFGFYNYLDNRFTARPLLRAMVQSQRPRDEEGLASNLLLVLLDEMNVARVELYLSDLLSKWELRRGVNDVRLEFDLGPDCDKYAVTLGRNILFVGTINEDESTQNLSDKVLDRGNLLYFPRPQKLASRASLQLPEGGRPLARAAWESWIVGPPRADEPADAALRNRCLEYCEVVERINNRLATVARPFGHRLWQAIELYLCNHPRVCGADDERELHDALQFAFEDQIVQRIVPKLRGLVNDGVAGDCLSDIGVEIAAHANGLEDDYNAALTVSERGFFWHQSTYLDQYFPDEQGTSDKGQNGAAGG
jgi:hypothetical protein